MTKNRNAIRLLSVFTALIFLGLFAVPSKVNAAEETVPLGTTSTFAVLAGTTVTNTGATTISGDAGCDVGIFPGTDYTGQETVTSDGVLHLADEVAGVAQGDLTTAYDNAAGRTPIQTISSELGGTTLKPGVYNSTDGSFQITGILTLDGNNETDPVFIFQTESTLITAADSSVSLINGAVYCRTFWQVGSSATLGSYSGFVGHIFALTSITAETGASVQGQLLARNGAVTLDSNDIMNGFCAAAVTPSPTETPTAAPTETPTAAATETPTAVPTVAAAVETSAQATPTPVTTEVTKTGEVQSAIMVLAGILSLGMAGSLVYVIRNRRMHQK